MLGLHLFACHALGLLLREHHRRHGVPAEALEHHARRAAAPLVLGLVTLVLTLVLGLVLGLVLVLPARRCREG